MKIVVCVKQVPDGTDAPIDSKDFTLKRDRAGQMLNPADSCAFEQALRCRDRWNASLTVMTLGPASAASMLKGLAAYPVDELIHISDPLFAGSDTYCTARIISAAIKFIGGCDIVLAGRRSTDGETGHVGPQIAALLDIDACVTNVTRILEVDPLTCERLLESETMTLCLPTPAVLTICGSANELRAPSIMGLKRAAAVQIRTLSAADLSLGKDSVGLAGSPTRVMNVWKHTEGHRKGMMFTDMHAGVSAAIAAILNPRLQAAQAEDASPASNRPVWAISLEDDAGSRLMTPELVHAIRSIGGRPIIARISGRDDTACAQALAAEIRIRRPPVVLFPATIRGRSIAPYCAALLGTGLTADCTSLRLSPSGDLIQIRPAYGGSLMAEIACHTWPQMASVRKGVYQTDAMAEEESFTIVAAPCAGIQTLASIEQPANDPGHSDRIISGGAGIGNKSGFALLERLAALLDGSVAASRSAVDYGYAPYARQVGFSGVTVRPSVYVAVGISGAVQHICGMKESGMVIAINHDPKAPIFDCSDIGIIAPWRETVELMIQALSAPSAAEPPS